MIDPRFLVPKPALKAHAGRKATDVACPVCLASIGIRCRRGRICHARGVAAAALTRTENAAARKARR